MLLAGGQSVSGFWVNPVVAFHCGAGFLESGALIGFAIMKLMLQVLSFIH